MDKTFYSLILGTLFYCLIINRFASNALVPIILILFGIIIFVSDEHPENASSPIDITLFGIVIFTIDEHR